jgi:hypothetical protein
MTAEAKGWLALVVFALACIARPVAPMVAQLVAYVAGASALWFALTMVRRAE